MITKFIYRAGLFFILLLATRGSFSQDDEDIDVMPFSKLLVKTNFRIPFTTSNNFLKEVSDGVVDLQGSVNYSFYKNVYVGVGYRYNYFKLSDRKLNSATQDRLEGKIEQQGFFGEVSYFYDLYEIFSIEANFQVGMERTIGSSKVYETNGGKTSNKGIFYSPNLNFYLKTEEIFSFFLSFGYNFSNTNFTPETVCKKSFVGFKESDYTDNYQHFNVGFGIGINIIKPMD